MSVVYDKILLKEFNRIVNAQIQNATTKQQGIDNTPDIGLIKVFNAQVSRLLEQISNQSEQNTPVAQQTSTSKPPDLGVKDITSLDNFVNYLKKQPNVVSTTAQNGFTKFKKDVYVNVDKANGLLQQLKTWAANKSDNLQSLVANLIDSFTTKFSSVINQYNGADPNNRIFPNAESPYNLLTIKNFSSNDSINNLLDSWSNGNINIRAALLKNFQDYAKQIKTGSGFVNSTITPEQLYFADQMLKYNPGNYNLSGTNVPEAQNAANQQNGTNIDQSGSMGPNLQQDVQNAINIIPSLIQDNSISIENISTFADTMRKISYAPALVNNVIRYLSATKSELADPNTQLVYLNLDSFKGVAQSITLLASYMIQLITHLRTLVINLSDIVKSQNQNVGRIKDMFISNSFSAVQKLESIKTQAEKQIK